MKKILLFLALGGLFLSLACTKSSPKAMAGASADDVVKSFVELSASARGEFDRKKLQELCAGEMRRTFERMNDEAFKVIYLDSKTAILDFKILESKVEAEAAKVAYQVTVDNRQGTDPTREINQREVDLRREGGAWRIENIRMRGSDQVAFTRGMLF